jgi:predicted transcriptional regulator
VNQAQGVSLMTVKVPSDVRRKLEEWAKFNVSSMNAELIRAVRERAEREQREKAAG